MSLWGKGADAATNKPKNLSTNENSQYKKQDVYATNSGWVQRAGTKASGNDNANATPEVLVAIRGLAGTSASTGLQEATITNLRFIIGTTAATDLTAGSSSQTVLIEITWDEAVTVTGAPVMKVVNSGGDLYTTQGGCLEYNSQEVKLVKGNENIPNKISINIFGKKSFVETANNIKTIWNKNENKIRRNTTT